LRLSTYFLLVPAVLIAAVLAVANREMVPLSFDPFSDTHPALVVEMPLFLLLFLTLILGVIIGGMVAIIGRRKRVRPQPERETSQAKALTRVDAGGNPEGTA
jgi:uncharacterized integral membrane protein